MIAVVVAMVPHHLGPEEVAGMEVAAMEVVALVTVMVMDGGHRPVHLAEIDGILIKEVEVEVEVEAEEEVATVEVEVVMEGLVVMETRVMEVVVGIQIQVME